MLAPVQALYVTPAMRSLLRDEAAMVRSRLTCRPGTHGLQLSMHAGAVVDSGALMHWVRLHAAGPEWHGGLRARTDAPLPFANESFSVVILSQVHQHDTACGRLLREVERVTAPDGLVILSGVHPMSPWSPWLWWQLHGMPGALRLHSPFQLGQALVRCSLSVREVRRFGPLWPHDASVPSVGGILGGGYLVVAHKKRHAVTPLRALGKTRAAQVSGSLASHAHRECA